MMWVPECRSALTISLTLVLQSDFARISSSFAGPFDRAAVITEARFLNPFYKATEWLLPYGRRFRADVKQVQRFGRELVREMKRKISEEEETGQESIGVGKGALLRELSKDYGGDGEDEAFVADACLNFLTAGESSESSEAYFEAKPARRPGHHRSSSDVGNLSPDVSPRRPATHPQRKPAPRRHHHLLGSHGIFGPFTLHQRIHL